jgi:hypothetical protein
VFQFKTGPAAVVNETENKSGIVSELIQGIQIGDYCFSNSRKWVLPHDQIGLSFSANWQHLKGIHKLKSSKNPGKTIDVK